MNKDLIEKLAIITEEEKRILLGALKVNSGLYTQSNDFVFDSQKLLHTGKLIEIRPYTRFIHFPQHKHNDIEVFYMCQGSTTHLVYGQKIVLNESDLLFLNQQVIQEIYPVRKDDITVNFIILPYPFKI